jgi:hypothetical protein
MENPRYRHAVRDGSRVLRFDGELLIALSSQRPGVPRWSRVSLYRLNDGYVVEKVGVSAVTHEPWCRRVRPDMIAWADAHEEDRRVRRVPCLECQPDLREVDAQLRLESTRYRSFVVPDAAGLVSLLTEGRAEVPILITRVLDAAAEIDEEIADAWLIGV